VAERREPADHSAGCKCKPGQTCWQNAAYAPDAASVQELKDAGLLPYCGEWVDVAGEPMRCTARAEFILWGKLIPPDGLGPRCYDHAAKHIGHHGLTRPGKSGWAVADLRPLIRQTGGAL